MFSALLVSCLITIVLVVTMITFVVQHPKEIQREPADHVAKAASQIIPTNSQPGFFPSIKPSTGDTNKRWNVIILTHMSSGSTFTGNIFNLHPDVFFLYEPLHTLRRSVYRDEWNPFDKTTNDAYRKDFSNLLHDVFACGFQEEVTLARVLPPWVRSKKRLTYWRFSSPGPLSSESVRNACRAKKLTVAKVMQTRLPREIGIQEIEKVCSADPSQYDCLIIHLIRDPRAVVSSLLRRKFFLGGPKRKLLTSENLTTEGMQLVKQNAQLLCSQVSDNLNYVKENWSKWFKGRYKLMRYEDIVGNAANTVDEMYNFVGLSMVDSIYQWIVEGKQPLKTDKATFTISDNDASRIDHWRSDRDPSLVNLFEEACAPLMKLVGYIFVNGSERLQHNFSKPLLTNEIPLLKDLLF